MEGRQIRADRQTGATLIEMLIAGTVFTVLCMAAYASALAYQRQGDVQVAVANAQAMAEAAWKVNHQVTSSSKDASTGIYSHTYAGTTGGVGVFQPVSGLNTTSGMSFPTQTAWATNYTWLCDGTNPVQIRFTYPTSIQPDGVNTPGVQSTNVGGGMTQVTVYYHAGPVDTRNFRPKWVAAEYYDEVVH